MKPIVLMLAHVAVSMCLICVGCGANVAAAQDYYNCENGVCRSVACDEYSLPAPVADPAFDAAQIVSSPIYASSWSPVEYSTSWSTTWPTKYSTSWSPEYSPRTSTHRPYSIRSTVTNICSRAGSRARAVLASCRRCRPGR